MGRIKKINSRRNLKSKKRRKASVNRIKKKNSNKYTKKKINVKRRGIKYYSSGGSDVNKSVEVEQGTPVASYDYPQKPDYLKKGEAGGLSLMLADDSLEQQQRWLGRGAPMRQIHEQARANAEAECRVGSGSCGNMIAQRNMRWFAPHYGENKPGIKYNINRDISKDAKSGRAGKVTLKCTIIERDHFFSSRELGTVEINYKLYPPSIEGTKQSGGYIYLISLYQMLAGDFYGRMGMQILCSEIAWLLHNNYIQIYWDMLVNGKGLTQYYYENRFRVVHSDDSGNYKTIIPELKTVSDTDIMIVNISTFIKRCQSLNIQMGPYEINF